MINRIKRIVNKKGVMKKRQTAKGTIIAGFRAIPITENAGITPTPTATPVKLIKGILEAKYRKPSNTMATDNNTIIE